MPALERQAFEENKGQVLNSKGEASQEVRYHYRAQGFDIFLLPTGIAYQFNRVVEQEPALQQASAQNKLEQMLALGKKRELHTHRFDVELVGANPNAELRAYEKSADYTNYYNRNALGVHSYERLEYKDVYPGIDWIIYQTEQGLKYDFLVAPGADPSQIALRYKGQKSLGLQSNGSLRIETELGSLVEAAPVSFQEQEPIGSRYVLEGNTLRFALDDYNSQKLLRIDPDLLWATYYSGNGRDQIYAVTGDAQGNIYFAGYTLSSAGIADNGFQMTFGGSEDAFLVKMNRAGQRVWGTYYGGTSLDNFSDLTIDESGSFVYAVGAATDETPVVNGTTQQQQFRGDFYDGLLVKFRSDGTIVWDSYFGGSGNDIIYGCKLRGDTLYICGSTDSPNGISTAGTHQTSVNTGSGFDAFVAALDTSGATLWGSYYGGPSIPAALEDAFTTLDIDVAGNIYTAGNMSSTGMATTASYQASYGGGDRDGILVKWSSTGQRIWATYIGGADRDDIFGMTLDANANIYIAGRTVNGFGSLSAGAVQPNYAAGANQSGLMMSFDSTGSLRWGSYYGTSNSPSNVNEMKSCQFDAFGNLYYAGFFGTGLATAGSYQDTVGDYSTLLLQINPTTGQRIWASYLGERLFLGKELNGLMGSNSALFPDAYGSIYIGGSAGGISNALPTTPGAHQAGPQGSPGYIAKFGFACTATTGSEQARICAGESYMQGNSVYTAAGTYTDTLYTVVGGCDSIVTLTLTVDALPDASLQLSSDNLEAAATSGGSYQWLDCDNGNAAIAGATAQVYAPTVTGNYAVSITDANGCSVVSACELFIPVSTEALEAGQLKLYPNPAKEQAVLDLSALHGQVVSVRLLDMLGRELWSSNLQVQDNQLLINLQSYPAGLYILQVADAERSYAPLQLVKE